MSKRTRFEVLRRDNHQCRYCGASAPDVPLTVDHVVPVALGGSDDPSNLATACRDCNAGKSSISPDSAIVADVEQDAMRWSAAMQRAAEIEHQTRDDDFDYFCTFTTRMGYAFDESPGSMHYPSMSFADWDDAVISVARFRDAGLNLDDLTYAIRIAMRNTRLSHERIWRYFCGVCWRMIEDRQKTARALLEAEEAGDGA